MNVMQARRFLILAGTFTSDKSAIHIELSASLIRLSGITAAVVLDPRFAAFQMKLNGFPLSGKLPATLLIAQFNKKRGRRFLLIISRSECAASGYALK
ncbi:MAG: hypothetical protein JNK38_20560 [Acidobacteria bacterium]|nr:hypothetical protein [Acidobacteriota bacterium]